VEDFYLFEIVGLRVITEDGEEVGMVEEVMETKANDVYVIRKDDGSELLLPAIESVIRDINFDEEVIVVALPEWDN
jgi:16S rRNA processing protein RimM